MGDYVVQDVRLFDGEALAPEPCTVCISHGKISYVGPAPPAQSCDDAIVISGSGCTLLPGLIDAHTHVFRSLEALEQCIPMGVTTVLDMHNEPDNMDYLMEECRKSNALPDILSAYSAATVAEGWPRAIMRRFNRDPEVLASLKHWPALDTDDSIEDFVVKNKSRGASFIKLMQESGECLNFDPLNAPTLVLQATVVRAAHKHGLLTVAHATNLRETMLVLEAGVDGLAHQFFDKPHTSQLIDTYAKHGAFVIPTLTAASSMIGLPSSNEFAKDPRAISKLAESTKACLCDHMNIALPYCNIQYAYDCVRALKLAGVDIVCGTDSAATIQGTALGASVHHEMSLYVQHCMFSPIEALKSATSVTARRFGLTDRGIVAEGKIADVLLVRGDPTVEISDTLNIESVWKQGVQHHIHGSVEKGKF